MKLRAIKTIKELAIRKQRITDYINGFIHRNIGEQGSDIKTSHDYIALVNVTIQELLDEGERISNYEGTSGKRS